MNTLLLATVVSAAAASCCNPSQHARYDEIATATTLCETRGGVAITDLWTDDGGHVFRILKQCAFPCGQQLSVEKP